MNQDSRFLILRNRHGTKLWTSYITLSLRVLELLLDVLDDGLAVGAHEGRRHQLGVHRVRPHHLQVEDQ